MINIPPIKYKSDAKVKLSLSGFATIPPTATTIDDKNKMIASQSLFTGMKYSSKAAKNVFIECAIAASTSPFLSDIRNVRSPFLILNTSMIIRMPIRKNPANNMVDL